jgi:hypothetical protein
VYKLLGEVVVAVAVSCQFLHLRVMLTSCWLKHRAFQKVPQADMYNQLLQGRTAHKNSLALSQQPQAGPFGERAPHTVKSRVLT